jgi:hypothetical protein
MAWYADVKFSAVLLSSEASPEKIRSAEFDPKIARSAVRSFAFVAAISAAPASSGVANVFGPVSEGGAGGFDVLQATSGRNAARMTAIVQKREMLIVRFRASVGIAILPVT